MPQLAAGARLTNCRKHRRPRSRRRIQKHAASRLNARSTPQLLQPRIAAASALVKLVARRVLYVIVLVIVLGGIELSRFRDLGDDLPLERLALLQCRPRRFGKPLLLVVVVEDAAAVLGAVVAELRVLLRGIDVAPETSSSFS